MNNSKSLINIPSSNKKIKLSKSLQNFKLVKELKNKVKKDTDQNLNELEIDVSEIKLNN